MNKNSKILVLGHTGLVGSSVLEKLQDEGYYNVHFPKTRINLINQTLTSDYINSIRPEYIFLCAESCGIHAEQYISCEFYLPKFNDRSECYSFGTYSCVEKLLYLGSSCIYPRNCPQPIKEEYLLTSELEKTNEPYADCKNCRFEND